MIRAFALAAVLIAAPLAARADGGAIVVVGGAPAHVRAVIAAAVEDTARRAAWSVAARPTPSELATVVACLQAERPWPCLAPALEGAQQLIVVQAEVETAQVVLTGQLVVAGGGVPAIDRRYCAGCDDDGLARAAEAMARQLLRDSAGRAALDVRSAPPGAASSRSRAAGRALPALVIAAGAIAVAGGAYASWTADAPLAGPQPRYRYDGVAIGVAVAGAGAIGAGIVWWWRRTRSVPVVAVGAHGAIAGWFTEL